MTLRDKLKTIPDGHWLMLSAPPIHHMMTGIERAGIRKDHLIQAHYEGGEVRQHYANEVILSKGEDEFTLFVVASYFTDEAAIIKTLRSISHPSA